MRDRTCLILDDIIDTAGTLVKTCQALLDAGARQVYACATHAVLSGPALQRIAQSDLVECVVTNTIPLDGGGQGRPEDQAVEDRRAGGPGNSVDSRRDIRQQTVLIKE